MTTKACKYYFKILKENTLICKNNLEKNVIISTKILGSLIMFICSSHLPVNCFSPL